MNALIRKELRLSRRFLMIWMGLILTLGGFAYFEYLSLQDSLAELAGLMDTFPKILMIMFGVGDELTSPLGWYGCIYFWVAILSYSYAVYLGVSCVTKEMALGTAEYLFTKPVSRKQIVTAKTFACIFNLFVLAVFSGLCNYFTSILPLGGLEQNGAVVTTTIGMFLTEAVLFSLTLMVSSLAKTYKKAVWLGAGLLLIFYGIYIVAEYLNTPALYYLTPLKYFDVYIVAKEGFHGLFLLASFVIILVSTAVARNIWTGKEI